MDRLSSPVRLMILSDLDNTMVDHHDTGNRSLLRFNALWEAKYHHDSLLVFSTGRSPTSYKELRKKKPLLTPDITIMSVGTEITYSNSVVPDDDWVKVLDHKWDRKVVIEETSKLSELELQSDTEQRPHKVGFTNMDKAKAQEVTKFLLKRFQERGIIYSGGKDLDILPQHAGKGQALAYLLSRLEGEGKQLFVLLPVATLVSNAEEELQWYNENAKNNPKIWHATEMCTAGIVQAIGHLSLGPNQ